MFQCFRVDALSFLVVSAGEAELNIKNINGWNLGGIEDCNFNWEVANRIGEKLVTANDAATITIKQLDLTGMHGASDQFNSFNFESNVKGDINLTIGEIYTDENTKINGLVSRDNGSDLYVLVNSNIVLDGPNTSIGYLALSKNNGSDTFFNLYSNNKSIKLSGGTVIDKFLVSSTGGDANLLDSTGG